MRIAINSRVVKRVKEKSILSTCSSIIIRLTYYFSYESEDDSDEDDDEEPDQEV